MKNVSRPFLFAPVLSLALNRCTWARHSTFVAIDSDYDHCNSTKVVVHNERNMKTKVLLSILALCSSIILSACQSAQTPSAVPATLSSTASPVLQTSTAEATATIEPLATSTPYRCAYKNIAFIGGSITRGAGASAPPNAYASKVGKWFIDKCGNEINVKNVSIGGTGSDFATYRLEHDLNGFIPDIAFYEFAVNDRRYDETHIRKHVEALIYKLRQINPKVVIFAILATNDSDAAYYESGTLPPTVDTHKRVASDHDIPIINVGQLLWQHVFETEADVHEYLRDAVHPNDAGHQFYYEAIIQFLASYFENGTRQTPKEQYNYNGDLANATIVDMAAITSTNCERLTEADEIYLLCTKGNDFSALFPGNMLGIVGEIRSDGGRLKCIVDRAAVKNADFWDKFALSANRTSYFFLFDNLEKKQHVLTCSVLDEIVSNASGSSQGNTVKIFYLMINP